MGQILERGTALKLVETEAVLIRCLFSKYAYGSYYTTVSIRSDNISLVEHTKKWIGGAMVIVHSNITIVRSTFLENRAQQGGAIHAENSSVIVINASIFKSNASSKIDDWSNTTGGALYATKNCSIYINGSYFERNVASGRANFVLGGTFALYKKFLVCY